MEALKRLFSSWRATGPERVPTDTVIPLFDLDDNQTNRNLAFELTMQFDEDEGKLEYHVQAEFTKERPPINFTKAAYEISVSEHPVTAKMPRGRGKLEAFDVSEPLSDALQLKDNTRVLADWINTDVAQLGLHACTFTDATFVTVMWLHTLLDAMGRRALFKAWTAVLEGRDDDVPSFAGYDSNPLAPLGAPPSPPTSPGGTPPKLEPHVLAPNLLRGLGFLRFVLNMIWEVHFHPTEAGRMICMPASYLSALRARAFADLTTLPASQVTLNASTGKPFLSDGDILCAWLTQLLARANPLPGHHLSSVPHPTPEYIANCACAISSLFTMKDFIALPLGHIAARLRRSKNGSVAPTLFSTRNISLSAFTNWAKARLFETDFSAAIVREATVRDAVVKEVGSMGKRGRPVYIHPRSTAGKGFSVRGSGSCVGVDGEGNVWLGCVVRGLFGGSVDRLVEEAGRETDRERGG
ncbi:hypothetical protein BU23DRAFT_592715 [Bimuria novae-zelandiae CBS 107.79]|uniref:LysR family regulatory protein n=1 Tax=Bimuria novae-zelandiae CBS 107.79 TaxID=1447943 RepID=A0A6A5UQT6_9PLEO|nr:hypothetical protein BU23DRAFT_592715 [Bimuria novae-zelandiae CBS 107.79]